MKTYTIRKKDGRELTEVIPEDRAEWYRDHLQEDEVMEENPKLTVNEIFNKFSENPYSKLLEHMDEKAAIAIGTSYMLSKVEVELYKSGYRDDAGYLTIDQLEKVVKAIETLI